MSECNRIVDARTIQLYGITCLVAIAAGGCELRQPPPLVVFCAAGMRAPMEAIADRYQSGKNRRVQLQFGGSNTLLSQIELAKIGDLFLAADASYIREAERRGLAHRTWPVAVIRPVILSRPGVPTHDRLISWFDADLRWALAEPEAAAIGLVTRQVLTEQGIWERAETLARQQGVFLPTVGAVANAVELGSVDAGIVWDAVAAPYDGLVVTRLESLDGSPSTIEIAVLNSAEDSQAAIAFAKYVADPDHGLVEFARFGFDTNNSIDGDEPGDIP